MKQSMKVCINPRPTGTTNIFRVEVADDILRLLADAHETEFTVPELVDMTGAARSTVWRAINLLDSIGAIRIKETPQRNYVAIDTDRLQKDDPILAIEQTTFHKPVRSFVRRVQETVSEADEINGLEGVIVFGSVARGTADRQSDIDLFVLVDGNRTTARRLVTDVVATLSDKRFDGDRFEFEPYVESIDSAERAGSKLQDIFKEGITVFSRNGLQSIRKQVLANE